MLAEVAFAVRQRDRGQRQAHIGGGAQRIPGQHAQAPAIRRELRHDRDFHGEIGDHAAFAWFLRGISTGND